MVDTTSLVIEHARNNGGVITTSEAVALGMAPATLSRRAQTGILIRLRQGVFALPGFEDRHRVDLEAACHALGAVTSHQSAGALHGLNVPLPSRPTVTVPHRHTKTYPGVVVHQSTDLNPDHVTQITGLPVTSPERTVIDLAAVLSDGYLGRVLDVGIASRKVSVLALADLFEQLARRGKPGTRRMRRELEKREFGHAETDTVLEIRLLSAIRRGGLPEPVSQFRAPWLKPINGRVDFAYPDRRLVVEADSRRWHTLYAAFERDRRRDNAAQLAGWRILRFTWDDVVHDEAFVVSSIRTALSQT